MSEDMKEDYEKLGRLVDFTHGAYVSDNMTWEWLGRAVVADFRQAFAPTALKRVPLTAFSNARGKEAAITVSVIDTALSLEAMERKVMDLEKEILRRQQEQSPTETVLKVATVDTAGLLEQAKYLEGVLQEVTTVLSDLRDAVLATTPSTEDAVCGTATKVVEMCARARAVLKLHASSPATTTSEGEKI